MLIQRTSMMRDHMDWPTLQAEAEKLTRGARSTRDTYAAIRLVLRRLGDNHSHLADPETVRAHRAGANKTLGLTASSWATCSSVVLLPRDQPSVSLVLRRAGSPELVRIRLEPRVTPFDRPAKVHRLDDRVGYVEIPGVVSGGAGFDADALAAIRGVDKPATCGWIVDLRRNVGGNMWPMLHALRPILGEQNPFTYRYGKHPWENRPVYTRKRPTARGASTTARSSRISQWTSTGRGSARAILFELVIDQVLALIVDEGKWLPLAMGLALVCVAVLLQGLRGSPLDTRRRVAAAMNLFFGVTIGTMAFGHLAAVTTKLALGTLRPGSLVAFYGIGIVLAVPSAAVVVQARKLAAGAPELGRRTLTWNAWLALTLLALGLHNFPLAAPGVFNIGYELHSRRVVGWAIVGLAVAAQLGLFVAALVFLASGQSFEQFRGIR